MHARGACQTCVQREAVGWTLPLPDFQILSESWVRTLPQLSLSWDATDAMKRTDFLGPHLSKNIRTPSQDQLVFTARVPARVLRRP